MKTILIGIFLLLPTYLFAAGSQLIEVEQLVKTITSWDGSELPSYSEGQAEVTILRITIPVGGEVPWHIHPTINTGFIIANKEHKPFFKTIVPFPRKVPVLLKTKKIN